MQNRRVLNVFGSNPIPVPVPERSRVKRRSIRSDFRTGDIWIHLKHSLNLGYRISSFLIGSLHTGYQQITLNFSFQRDLMLCRWRGTGGWEAGRKGGGRCTGGRRRGREAGFPRWREAGEKGKNATLRNISQSKKYKEVGGNKCRVGSGKFKPPCPPPFPERLQTLRI